MDEWCNTLSGTRDITELVFPAYFLQGEPLQTSKLGGENSKIRLNIELMRHCFLSHVLIYLFRLAFTPESVRNPR